jgi:hypothetical protein
MWKWRTGSVDFFARARGQIRFDGDDAARFDADVDRLPVLRRGARRQHCAADDQIHGSLPIDRSLTGYDSIGVRKCVPAF